MSENELPLAKPLNEKMRRALINAPLNQDGELFMGFGITRSATIRLWCHGMIKPLFGGPAMAFKITKKGWAFIDAGPVDKKPGVSPNKKARS